MDDGIGLAEALLGLPGFRVVDVIETDSEVVVSIESTATRVFCRGCGERAEAHDRLRVDIRDLACFGRLSVIRLPSDRARPAMRSIIEQS